MKRYRPCAGALVFDAATGRLLVGERNDRPGQWQCAQGGIDGDEAPAAAAARELYEEMGLRAPAVEQLATLGETTRYDVGFGWLKEAGFAGQEMHWTLFVYRGDADDVGASVDLSGLGGEKVGRVEGVQTDRWRLGCASAFI